MYPAVVSPFLADLDGLLRSVLSARCAPIGILGVIAVPRLFHVRLSEALLHRAGWLGDARSEKIFEGLYEHLARLASTMLLEDQHPVALVLTGGCDVFRVAADREALRACGLRPRTLSRVEPLIMALVTETLLTSSPASGRVH